jgi:hypothetical protein
MNDSISTVARHVAPSTITFNQQQTGYVPQAVTMILSDEMLRIALHAAWTPVEESQAESPLQHGPGAEVSWASIHEHQGLTAVGQPTDSRCETLPVTGEDEMITGLPTPVWLLRRWLAAALQCGEMSLAEGHACMQALDDFESRA